MTVSEQLRDIVKKSGLSMYRLGNDTGVSQSALGRFVRGEGTLHSDAIDAVAKRLGARLVVAKSGKRRAEGAK